jgi:phosphomannomutase/phosphoglucomutase
MKFNPSNFRTYDIRGLYPRDLGPDFAYSLGLAYSAAFPNVKTAVVAMDLRRGSPELLRGLANGLLDAGIGVFEIAAEVPVSVMSFVICRNGLSGGIMVTASHNPPQWNGFKLQLKNAYPVISETFEKLRIIMEKGDFKKSEKRGKLIRIDPRDEYVEYLAGKIRLRRSLKVILDSGNAACGYLPEKIFKKLGCETETIYGDFDVNFPNHLPDPYEEKNLEDLRKRVVKAGADAGFAYDGDGDRLGVVDKAGRIVKGDQYLIIFAREALKIKKGPVICEVRTSQAFLDDVKAHGGETFFSVAYHKAVLDKIIEKNAVFGGETTGHLYFPLDYFLYDDAIFASLKMAEVMAEKEDFTGYVDSLPRYATSPEIFIDYPDETKKQAVDRFTSILKSKGYKFIDIDGARVVFENGWALARISNTSPMIKIRFEGRTGEDLEKIEKEIIPLLAEADIRLSAENYESLGLKK